MKRNIRVYYEPVYYDEVTGEILTHVSPEQKHKAINQFFKGYNDGFAKLCKLSLSKNTYQLILYILSSMAYNNKFYYDCRKTAETLNLHDSAVSNAMKELVNIGFCVPVLPLKNKLYVVNPEFGFKGRDSVSTQKWFNKLQYQYSEHQIKLHSNTVIKNQSVAGRALLQKLQKSKTYNHSKSCQLVEYLVKLGTEPVCKTVAEIVAETCISKVTVIDMLKFLQQYNFIKRNNKEIKIHQSLHQTLQKFYELQPG